MNSIQVIAVVAFALSMLLVYPTECMEQDESKTATVNKKCFNPLLNNIDPMECCKIPSLLDLSLIHTCASNTYGNDSDASKNPNEPPIASHIRCVTECMLNETGLIKDQNFQPGVGLEMAKKQLGPKSIWLPIVSNALETCHQSIPQEIKSTDHRGCGHLAAFIVACLNSQLFKNCPQSIWNDTQECTELLDLTKNCPVTTSITSNA